MTHWKCSQSIYSCMKKTFISTIFSAPLKSFSYEKKNWEGKKTILIVRVADIQHYEQTRQESLLLLLFPGGSSCSF